MNRRASYLLAGFVGLLAIIWVIPIFGVIVTSIRPPSDIVNGWWGLENIDITFEAWLSVWDKYPLANAFWMSFKLTVLATVITILLAPAAAYAFHYLRFRGRLILLIVVINSFVLPQQIVVIPLFTLWRDLGLLGNIWAVVIPYVGMSFGWSIFLIKSFLEDFPKELIEASKIDNCGPIQTFVYIVFPNSLTSIMAVGILQFLWCWNSLLLPMLYLRIEVPLPVLLARVVGTYEDNFNQQAVAAIITTAVPLIIFIMFQKHFVAGSNASGGK